MIRRATRWFLRNLKPNLTIEETIQYFSPPIAELVKQLPELLTDADREQYELEMKSLLDQGVPELLAKRVGSCNILFTSLDIVEAALKHHLNITEVAETYYNLGDYLELNWLRDQMNTYPIDNQWDELARSGFRDDLDRAQRKLSVSVLLLKQKKLKQLPIKDRITVWLDEYELLIMRWRNLLTDIKSSNNVGFVTYSVVLRELFDFAHA